MTVLMEGRGDIISPPMLGKNSGRKEKEGRRLFNRKSGD